MILSLIRRPLVVPATLASCLLAGAASASTEETWLFNSLSGWTGVNATLTIVGGSLHIHPTTSDPQAVSPNNLGFTPTATDYIRTNIKSLNTNGQYQIYFKNGAHGFQEANSKIYNISTDQAFHYYTIPLSGSHPNSQLVGMGDWGSGSTVTQIRLDPARSVSGDVEYDFVALRQDDQDPYRPLIDSVSPSGWTTGTITVEVHGNDPPPRGHSLGDANPDAYGSGVFDFGWRIDGGTETWQQYTSFPDVFKGTAYLTLTFAPGSVPAGCHTLSIRSRDRCGRIGAAHDTTLYVGPDPGYRITGRSTSFETGDGVAGDVITYGAECGPISGQVTTDANGYYQTPSLPIGSYSVGAGSCDDVAKACQFGNPVTIGCAGNQTVNFRQKGLITPTGLTVDPGADGTSFLLSWDPGNADTDHFRVYGSGSDQGPFVALGSGQTSFVASGYACAQPRYFRIAPVNACGREGQPGSTVGSVIPCPVVHGFVEDSSTHLAVGGATVTLSSGATVLGTTTTPASGAYSFTLPAGGTYGLLVSQPDGYWNSSESFAMDPLEDYPHVVSLLPVGVPTDVASVTREEDNSIFVTWRGTEAATSRYELFSKVSALDDSAYALTATIFAPDTSYSDHPTDGLAHDYKVRAVVDAPGSALSRFAKSNETIILTFRSKLSSNTRGEPVAGFGATPPPRSVVAKNLGDSQTITVHVWPPAGSTNFAGIDEVLIDVFDHPICNQSAVPAQTLSANPRGINGELVARIGGFNAGQFYSFQVRFKGKKGTSQPTRSDCSGVMPQPPPCVLVPGFKNKRQDMNDFGQYLHRYGVQRVGTVGFTFPSGTWSSWVDPLKQEIEAALSPNGNWPYDEMVDMVGYSQGGLAARGYIEGGGNARVRKLVMMGTPNHGGQFAATGSLLPPWLILFLGPGIVDLSPTSSALRKLNYGSNSSVVDGLCQSSPVESNMLQRKGATQYFTIAGTAGGAAPYNNTTRGLLFLALTANSCRGDGVVPRRSVRLRGLGGAGNCGQWMDSELDAAGWGVGLLTHSDFTSSWSKQNSVEFIKSEPLARFMAYTILAPIQSNGLGSIQCNPASAPSDVEGSLDDPDEIPAPDSIAVVATGEGTLAPAGIAVHQALLDASRRVTAMATTDSTTPNATLIDPDGNRYVAADTSSTAWLSYEGGGTSGLVAFSVEVPRPGLWRLELSNAGQDSMAYRAAWISEGAPLALMTATGPSSVDPGAAIPLRATLGQTPQGSVTTMTARVIDPNGSTSLASLHDDGLNPDELAGDGVFSSSFQTSSIPGLYRVQYEASVSMGQNPLLVREADTLVTLTILPDVDVRSVIAMPTLCEVGASVHLAVGLMNLGNLNSSVVVTFWDSTTAESIGVVKTVLAAGDSAELGLDWLPSARGEHRIGIHAETLDATDEDPDNNGAVITIPVSGPAPVIAVQPAPKVLELARPRPNPSMSSTSLGFSLPSDARANLDVFDVRGRRVRRLFGGIAQAGVHQITWDNRDDDGRNLSAGVYFVRLRVEGAHREQKLVIVP